jgi:integrase
MSSNAIYLGTLKTKTKGGKAYSYWVLQWRDSHGKKHNKTIGSTKKMSKRQAEKLRREMEYEMTKRPGRRNAGKAPPLGNYIESYLKNRRNDIRPTTLDLHKMTGRYLVAHFGDHRRIDTIQRPDARAFKAALATGDLQDKAGGRKKILSEWTIRQQLANCSKIFSVALEDDIINFNPFDKLTGKMPPSKGFHEVTDDEINSMLNTANPEWRIWLALCFYAGLRRGEALNIRWSDIDWERRRLTLIASDEWRPKDRDSRIVPIEPELFNLLLDAFDRADAGSDMVIQVKIDPRGSHKAFERLCKRASVTPWKRPFQALRKTRATRWARVFPQHVVSYWLGHAKITTTDQFYLQVSEVEYDRASGLFALKSALKPEGSVK